MRELERVDGTRKLDRARRCRQLISFDLGSAAVRVRGGQGRQPLRSLCSPGPPPSDGADQAPALSGPLATRHRHLPDRSGSRGALLRPGPLRTAHSASPPAAQASLEDGSDSKRCAPALTSFEPRADKTRDDAGLITVRWSGLP
jgi:hypothetical protein